MHSAKSKSTNIRRTRPKHGRLPEKIQQKLCELSAHYPREASNEKPEEEKRKKPLRSLLKLLKYTSLQTVY